MLRCVSGGLSGVCWFLRIFGGLAKVWLKLVFPELKKGKKQARNSCCMKRLSSSANRYFWIILALVSKVFFNLLISKYFAVVFAEEGLAVLMHFLNFVALLSFLPLEGVHRAWLSMAAKDRHFRTEIWYAAFFWDSVLFVAIIAVPTLFVQHFTGLFRWDAAQYFAVLASVLAYIFVHLFSQYFLWSKQYARYAGVHVLLSVASYAAVWWAGRFGDLSFVLTTMAISYWLPLLAGVWWQRGVAWLPVRRWLLAFYAEYKTYWQFILVAILAMLLDRLLSFEVRLWAIRQFGMSDTAYWQALVRVSELMMGLLAAFLSAAYYPIACEMPDGQRAWLYTRRQLYIAFPLLAVILLGVWLSRWQWLPLFFDTSFVQAAEWAHWQLLGDFFQFAAFWGGLLLLARQALLSYLALQLLWAVVYLVCLGALYTSKGVLALPLSHAISHLIYIGILYAYIVWKRP